MVDLFWPGDERAGALLSDGALLDALVRVEAAWLDGLVAAGIAPRSAGRSLTGLVGLDDVHALAVGAEAGGNPVIGLVALLRDRLSGDAARWVHRGLTSQDVLDTALALCLGDVAAQVGAEHRLQVEALCALARAHAGTAMVGRTLTQHAVPITFGLKAAVWLNGVLDGAETLAAARRGLVVQLGGAAGTLAATVELARLAGLTAPVTVVEGLVDAVAATLGLAASPPWHTVRTPFTRMADALVSCLDAYGHVAGDVATLSRPEIGELVEGRAGGSSTMPHKQNPVLSVLVRRAVVGAPGLAATVHAAAAGTCDERPDGAWHAEWAALRDLGRRTVVASSQTSSLVTGLVVDPDAMADNLRAAVGIDAEQRSMAALLDVAPSPTYAGLTAQLVERALGRGQAFSSLAPTRPKEQR